MRRLLLPLLIAVALLGASGLALRIATAAPAAQATATRTATQLPTRTSLPSPTRTTTPAATATTDDEEEPEAGTTITVTEAITGSILPPRLARPQEDVDPSRTLTVVGQGQANAAPDIATLTLGVESVANSVEEAADENNERVDAILAALADLEIPEENIQTSNYSIFPERPQVEPLPEVESTEPTTDTASAETTYRVTQQVTVRVEDVDDPDTLSLLSDIVEAAIEAGANNVFGPNFALSDDRSLRQRARREAVADAYAAAQDWATLTGVELIGVASISEVVGGGPGPVAFAQADEGGGGGPSFQPGTLSLSQQVQIIFYIR